MSKFRYYITDTFYGEVVGTNDEGLAKQFSQAEEYFVVDTEAGTWITQDAEVEVEELKSVSPTDEDGD